MKSLTTIFCLFQCWIMPIQSLEFQNCWTNSSPGQPLVFYCETDSPIESCVITQRDFETDKPIFQCKADLAEGEHWCYIHNLRVIITANSCEVIEYYMDVNDEGTWHLGAEGVDANGIIQVIFLVKIVKTKIILTFFAGYRKGVQRYWSLDEIKIVE